MDKISDFTTLARKTPCPECGRMKLDFALRCDLSFGACLYSANCAACGGVFEIVTADEAPDDATLAARVAPCAKCGGTIRTASLHCEISSRSCVYTLECADCPSS